MEVEKQERVKRFAALVDHTILKPQTTAADIARVCEEALLLGTASVCINGHWVKTAAQKLSDSQVAVCSVVGFPLGAMSAASVAVETQNAVNDGAQEIDMVVPQGLVKSGQYAEVYAYVEAVKNACSGALLKVILETAVLSCDEIKQTCEISVEAGADFVKTSTGFDVAGGASVETVSLMRQTVGDDVGVKAAGGIRTLRDVNRMVDAGASRLGMSAAMAIVKEIETT